MINDRLILLRKNSLRPWRGRTT